MPKRARPIPTTYDQPTPFPFPTSPPSRAALALRYRRVRDRCGPICDISRSAVACVTPCDASHPLDPHNTACKHHFKPPQRLVGVQLNTQNDDDNNAAMTATRTERHA
ncbi:hypothetical protein EDB83DRAFT_2533804 [Lactarius deliciosus]|nr:hypothetical protein EDB83DRAFT_2533804 [Lactarius deliciosus]